MKPKTAFTRIIGPGLVLWLLLFACNAPSIPMPPPDIRFFSFIQEPGHPNYVRLQLAAYNGAVPAGAVVTVRNLSISYDDFVGGIAGPDGEFETQPFEANEGDVISFDFYTDDQDGGVICMNLSFSATALEVNELCQ